MNIDDSLMTDLLAQVAQRSPTAFAKLFEMTRRPLTSAALSVLHSASDAEEVICDCMMYVWDHADRFEPTRGVAMAWLMTIVRHRSIDMLRKRRHFVDFDDGLLEVAEASVTPHATPVELMHRLDDARSVHSALQQLSSVRRTVLKLAYFEQMTHQQIAVELNMPSGTVKSNIRRGLMVMRDYMIGAGNTVIVL